MQTVILCFTENGARLAGKLVRVLEEAGHTCFWHIKSRYSMTALRDAYQNEAEGVQLVEGTLLSWTQAAFAEYDAIIFIGAAGIAVRAVAPFVMDKFHDPAVLVMDEAGQFVIPILSGHVGGANALALEIERLTGARAVLTTASDLQGKFAFDVFAGKNGLKVTNRVKAKEIAARIANGSRIPVYIAHELTVDSDKDVPLPEPLDRVQTPQESLVTVDYHYHRDETDALHLVPEKMVWIGIGCKQDMPAAAVTEAVLSFLSSHQLHGDSVAGVASIDLKAEEAGILKTCEEQGWPFVTFSAAELMSVPGKFSFSLFVRKQTGVDCVCERAACLAAGRDDKGLVVKKQKYEGVTLAAAVMERSLNFEG